MANLSDNYWSDQFDVTKADLDRLADHLKQIGTPCTITDLSKRIIRGRLKFGNDISSSAISSWAGKTSTRLWNPAEKWNIGDGVIVVRRVPPSNDYNTFVGEVILIEKDMITIHLDTGDVRFTRAEPGSENAINWHNIVREIVAQKMQSAEIEDRVTGVLAQFGDRVVSRISEVLKSDERFIGIKGHWYLVDLVPVIQDAIIHDLYKTMLSKNGTFNTEQLLQEINQDNLKDIISELSLITAMNKHPNLFQIISVANNPQWKSVAPLPGECKSAYYTYDPNTFEIICEPGEVLNQKKIQRLQELNLLAQVIGL